MAEIAPDVAAALDASDADAPVRLLISCDPGVRSVVEQLHAGGVAIVQSLGDLDVVVVAATRSDSEVLGGLTGVKAIELEGEEFALDRPDG